MKNCNLLNIYMYWVNVYLYERGVETRTDRYRVCVRACVYLNRDREKDLKTGSHKRRWRLAAIGANTRTQRRTTCTPAAKKNRLELMRKIDEQRLTERQID